MTPYYAAPTEFVGSGVRIPSRDHLPKYPTVPELVLEEENEKVSLLEVGF